MSEANKAIVRRWFEEVWNKGRAAAIDELATPESIFHGLGPQPVVGRQAFKVVHATYRGAFPDIRIDVDDVFGEDDRVAVRWTATATHLGTGFGVAATNKPVTFTGLGIAIIVDGQVAESWNAFEELALMLEIGAVHQP